MNNINSIVTEHFQINFNVFLDYHLQDRGDGQCGDEFLKGINKNFFHSFFRFEYIFPQSDFHTFTLCFQSHVSYIA